MIAAKHICIVGTGYVGMANAIGFSRMGHTVAGYDIIRERVRSLAGGVTPYREPGIGAALGEQLETGRLRFVENLEYALHGADFIIVAVETPSTADGGADLSHLNGAIASLSSLLGSATIVLRSTVPVGTSARIARTLAGRAEVLYAPEFLREGRALDDFLNPDRIVIGAGSGDAAVGYAGLFEGLDSPTVITSYQNAELIKAFANAFLATKISFANEVANFCDVVDADALEVLQAIGMDKRIGSQFLHPGIGFGGPCFEKDVKSLIHQAEAHGVERSVLTATLATNQRQPRKVLTILEDEIGALFGRRIGIWGLTFKADTDDLRDSLALRVIDDLVAAGAQIRAYDPGLARAHILTRCEIATSALDAVSDADALVVLTDWREFASVDVAEVAARMRGRLVVDGRNILRPEALSSMGLRYRGIGRRAEPSAAVAGESGDDGDAIAV